MKTPTENRKLVVIGLDGGSFSVIDPLIEEGRLPNIEKLIKEGVSGPLLSTMPPVTGPAWVSFMTGKSPGAHGLFDFVRPVANEYRRQIVNYNDIKSATLWSILSENGKNLGIINVPLTYPPPKVNGFLISGMLTPGIESEYTYPPSLAQELEKKFGRYTLDIWWQHYGPETIKTFLKDLMVCTDKRKEVILHFMRNREWDFFMAVFIGTDRIQHALWNYLVPTEGKKLSKIETEIRELIIQYYEKVDDIIGNIVDTIDGKANLMIMSDHGFGPLKGKFRINRWLEESGLLTYDPVKIKKFRLKAKIGPFLRQIVRKADPLNLRKKLTARITKNPERMGAYSFLDCINWSKTVAYAASNTEQGIYINLAGREPSGIVRPGKDWDEARDMVINRLKDIRDPHTNEKLVSRIYKREDIYSGPYVNNAPDIIFFLKEGEYLADVQPMNNLFEEISWKTGTGTHRMEGIFVGYGKDIKAGLRIADAEIIDLAPTILNLMGVRIPDDMDGNALTHIFTDEFLNDNPSQYVEGPGGVPSYKQEDGLYSDKEAEELEAQLKGLGYL